MVGTNMQKQKLRIKRRKGKKKNQTISMENTKMDRNYQATNR
jgi:hypothetical protein